MARQKLSEYAGGQSATISAKDSLDRLREVVDEALRERFPRKKGGKEGLVCPMSVYLTELTPDRVVFEKDGSLMACRYSKKGRGVELGREYEVEKVYRPAGRGKGGPEIGEAA